MAELNSQKRREVFADLMRLLSSNNETVSITKPDLRAVVDALDTFLNDNASTINSTIPQPGRSALSVSQKARILMLIIKQRFIEGV